MPAATTLPESLNHATAAVLGGWRSTALGNWPDAALFAVVLGVLVAFAIQAARDSGRSRAPVSCHLPLFLCLWAGLYLVALVWRSTQANFDPIGVRLTLPATVALIPAFGALVAAALPTTRRVAWLSTSILIVCFGIAFVREATLWSSGRDVRAFEFPERTPAVAARPHRPPATSSSAAARWTCHSSSPAASPSPTPAFPTPKSSPTRRLNGSPTATAPTSTASCSSSVPPSNSAALAPTKTPSNWLGPFIADIRAGHHEPYPLLEPLAALNEARIYDITCS